jgi:hypothetical protein
MQTKQRRRPRRNYSACRRARKRFLNSPLGKLTKTNLSRETREEILRNGFATTLFAVNNRIVGGSVEYPVTDGVEVTMAVHFGEDMVEGRRDVVGDR